MDLKDTNVEINLIYVETSSLFIYLFCNPLQELNFKRN